MSDQSHLNGAYYGPSIPPPARKSRSYNRPGSGGSCNPFSWCFSCLCGCIFNLICQILITILVVLGIIILVFWLIFRPNAPKFHVNEATLTQFTLSPNNDTLYYNLAVNMTFRNPNKRIGIYYDRIEANAEYDNKRFATQNLDTFYLGHKKERNLNAVFRGERVLVIGNDDTRKEYNSDGNDGVYDIELKLKIRLRLKVWWAKPKFKPRFECDLKVPISGGAVTTRRFERTKCDFDW